MVSTLALLRNSAHLLLVGTFVFLLYQLKEGQAISANVLKPNTHAGFLVPFDKLFTPMLVREWLVLTRTTLLGLALVRLGDIVGWLKGGRIDWNGASGCLGMREGEKFLGACAAGVWTTRHLLLMLLHTAQGRAQASNSDLAILWSSAAASVTWILLTIAQAVCDDEEVVVVGARGGGSAAKGQSTADASLDTELPSWGWESTVVQGRIVGRVMTLASLGLASLLVWVTLKRGMQPSTPLLLAVVMACSMSFLRSRLTVVHLILAKTFVLLGLHYTLLNFTLDPTIVWHGAHIAHNGIVLAHQSNHSTVNMHILRLAIAVFVGLYLQLVDLYLRLPLLDGQSKPQDEQTQATSEKDKTAL